VAANEFNCYADGRLPQYRHRHFHVCTKLTWAQRFKAATRLMFIWTLGSWLLAGASALFGALLADVGWAFALFTLILVHGWFLLEIGKDLLSLMDFYKLSSLT
jgi:hypothetical protein